MPISINVATMQVSSEEQPQVPVGLPMKYDLNTFRKSCKISLKCFVTLKKNKISYHLFRYLFLKPILA